MQIKKWILILKYLCNYLITKDELYAHGFSELIVSVFYPKYRFHDHSRICLDDIEFIRDFEKFDPGRKTYTFDRKYTVRSFANYAKVLPGDTVECGVFDGASSYMICKELKGYGRRHLLFDSFEGLSEPEAIDGTYWKKGVLACSEESVRHNLREFPFVEYYKGFIPSRFSEVADRRFSLVHIDVDLYQPTKDALEFFWPRMVPGGVIICDDYGSATCPGVHRAMHEVFDNLCVPIIHLPANPGVVIKVP